MDTTLMEMMTRPVDSALAARLMVREEAALREAIDLYGDLVFGIAKRVLAEPGLAEEVAQDAFLALWRRPGAFDPERGSLKTFLATMARNKAIDLVRREESVRRRAKSLMNEMESSADSSRFDDEVEARAEMDDALAQLSTVQREAITLAYFGGRTYREVASELGIAEGTAKTRLRDGLMKLRTALSEIRAEGSG
ncbi:MAG: sigma-70 family RNA polymerase sigma factor [Actinobacteria bacterium]|nr:sigma-70 family RNA polymerase sigma factor [Actinomycetota bacterium]